MAGTHLSMEVEGLKELQKQIRDLGDAELRKQLREANKSVAQMVVDQALPNVPVRSGKLRASLKASATQTSAYGKAGSSVRVPYAAAIHWGYPSRHIRAAPFLWDAADAVLNRAVKEYEDQLQSLIDKVVK